MISFNTIRNLHSISFDHTGSTCRYNPNSNQALNGEIPRSSQIFQWACSPQPSNTTPTGVSKHDMTDFEVSGGDMNPFALRRRHKEQNDEMAAQHGYSPNIAESQTILGRIKLIFTQTPFIAIGIIGATASVAIGLHATLNKNSRRANLMMKSRVGMQTLAIVALLYAAWDVQQKETARQKEQEYLDEMPENENGTK